MAIYKAINNGINTDISIWEVWDGTSWNPATVLPSDDDEVYANTYTITVTGTTSYQTWKNEQYMDILRDGQFQIDGSNDITIEGEIFGGRVSNSSFDNACVRRLSSHTGVLTQIGDCVAHLTYCNTFLNESDYDLYMIGNQYISNAASNSRVAFRNVGNGIINITGNQMGGTNNGVYAFLNGGNATIYITGNQIAGDNNQGIVNSASATITINGNQYGGGSFAISNNAGSTDIRIYGNAYASTDYGAVYNSDPTSFIIYQGNLYNNLGTMALFSRKIFINVEPETTWEFTDFDENPKYLVSENSVNGIPNEDDVRDGTIYGAVSGLTGTCNIPPAESVVKNVPVDDTVGTWGFDEELIERMGRCSTVDITGEQIAGFEE